MVEERQPPYTSRDRYLGVPEVEALQGTNQEQRQQKTQEVATYLEGCDLQVLEEAANKVEQLYAKSGTVMARFDLEHVDVFAAAAIMVLRNRNEPQASDLTRRIRHTRRIVSRQKGRSDGPALDVNSPLLTSVD